MTLSLIIKILLIIVKLASEVLKVVTVEENEYNDNHEKYVARQIQGKLLIKYEG